MAPGTQGPAVRGGLHPHQRWTALYTWEVHRAPPQVCPGLSDSSALSHMRHIHPSSPGRDAAALADQIQGDMHSLEDPESWQKWI